MALDDICDHLSPAVIKIDMEGGEVLALRGAKQSTPETPAYLMVAVHPEPIRMGTSPEQLMRYMRSLDYDGKHRLGR